MAGYVFCLLKNSTECIGTGSYSVAVDIVYIFEY